MNNFQNLKIDLPRNVSQEWAAGCTFQEPNLVLWEDEQTGLTCCAIRDECGHFWAAYEHSLGDVA